MATQTQPTWLANVRKVPREHQVIGVEWLFKLDDPAAGRVVPACALLADEMGAGKTKQAIDAALRLFVAGDIDYVIVLCPSAVRPVWYDPDPQFGELAKHLWLDVPCDVIEYHVKSRRWTSGPETGPRKLRWIITNYDFIGRLSRFQTISGFASHRTLLILDESSAVKNHRATRTKATLQLRRKCSRVWLLNGTPIANTPADMYSQGNIMDPRILACRTFFEFRARYAIMGTGPGWRSKVVDKWHNLDDLQNRFAPYVLRREKKDCLDLPPKLEPVTLSVPLSEQTWAIYKEIRDEMVAWLNSAVVAETRHASIKAMRLAQLCQGFIGGLKKPEDVSPEAQDFVGNVPTEVAPPWLPKTKLDLSMFGQWDFQRKPKKADREEVATTFLKGIAEVSAEKDDFVLDWVGERLQADPRFKVVIWCRFRPQVARLLRGLAERYPRVRLGTLWGQQALDERTEALKLLKPGLAPAGPVAVVGITSTGSMGLDFAACHTVLHASNGTSLKDRLQADERPHRTGQTESVWYGDVVATGPRGQKTIEHGIIKALRARQDIASWTVAAWVKALTEE
jgi:hypothetical protein